MSALPRTGPGNVATHVPFIDVTRVNARMAREIDEAVGRVLRSGWYILGEENRRFAEEFARFTGASHCVPVATGLDALCLTLRAWTSLGRLRPGDEVLVPANSFVASALAVTGAGLSLAFADVDERSMCLSAATVAAALTKRTRAIMPVHLYGQVADMGGIRELCKAERLLVLEDAAQAHGACASGTRAGALGDAAGFSFYPSKNLGALGDAGCMVTDDAALAHRVRMLGNYGSAEKYRHELAGTNSRMDELHAAVLRVKLPALDADNARRQEIARRYSTGIAHPRVATPEHPPEAAAHVWHLYVVRTDDRAGLARHLDAQGIETIVHYPCAIHRQPAFADTFASAHLPVAERLQHEVLSLPMSPVMTDADVHAVIGAVNGWDPSRASSLR